MAPIKVLIIDDDEGVVSSLKLGLTKGGYEVAGFTDPVEAIAKFRAGSHDIVLLDIRMPTMNGFEVYRALRKMDQKIKICFLTGFEIYRKEFDKMFPGMDIAFFLKKPISISELKKEIDKIVASP